MSDINDITGVHQEPTILDRARAWYLDGSGPRVRGAALRQRTIRTLGFIAVLVLLALVVHLFGGPWLSYDAIQTTMSHFRESPYGFATAILLFCAGFMGQVLAVCVVLALLINTIGLGIVLRRWRRWKRHQ